MCLVKSEKLHEGSVFQLHERYGSQEINFLLLGVNTFGLGRKERSASSGGQHRAGTLMEAGHLACVLVGVGDCTSTTTQTTQARNTVLLRESTVQPGASMPALLRGRFPIRKET